MVGHEDDVDNVRKVPCLQRKVKLLGEIVDIEERGLGKS